VGVAAWAVSQNVSASGAEDKARTMKEQRDALQPIKSQIEGLLKKENELRNIANAFTRVESDQAFWMDLLSEVRGAFASDAVWLIDFEPIHAYNPALVLGPKTATRTQNGKPVVKPEFFNTNFGVSSLAEIQLAPQNQPNKPGAAKNTQPAQQITVNAVRIKGFWRENPKSQNVVSDLLKNLRENSKHFRFTIKDDKGADQVLSDEQILEITVTGAPGELGLPFEITLPLKREIPVK
jgi:hypothetical protein